jgi:hypothetical protein
VIAGAPRARGAVGLSGGREALTGAAALDAALLAAHARDDRQALVGLYAEAASRAEGMARAFYLTQAHVFALDLGDRRAEGLKAMLVEMGADTP